MSTSTMPAMVRTTMDVGDGRTDGTCSASNDPIHRIYRNFLWVSGRGERQKDPQRAQDGSEATELSASGHCT